MDLRAAGARSANAAHPFGAEGSVVQRVGGLGRVPGGGGEARGPVSGRGFWGRLRALRTKPEVCMYIRIYIVWNHLSFAL